MRGNCKLTWRNRKRSSKYINLFLETVSFSSLTVFTFLFPLAACLVKQHSVMLFKSFCQSCGFPLFQWQGSPKPVQNRGGAVLLEGKGKLPWDVTAVTECRSQALKGWADSDH